uniref:Uncharacterized protein n=1 Tax=Triticum urartu TaxID=4572 RepID=A0A8R7QDZ7_TRIUA
MARRRYQSRTTVHHHLQGDPPKTWSHHTLPAMMSQQSSLVLCLDTSSSVSAALDIFPLLLLRLVELIRDWDSQPQIRKNSSCCCYLRRIRQGKVGGDAIRCESGWGYDCASLLFIKNREETGGSARQQPQVQLHPNCVSSSR